MIESRCIHKAWDLPAAELAVLSADTQVWNGRLINIEPVIDRLIDIHNLQLETVLWTMI